MAPTTTTTDTTHDASLLSWLASANDPATDLDAEAGGGGETMAFMARCDARSRRSPVFV